MMEGDDIRRQIRAWVGRFTYKPNFDFGVQESRGAYGHDAVVHITMYVPDSYRQHPPVRIDHRVDDIGFYRERMILADTQYTQNLPLIPVGGSFTVPPNLAMYTEERREDFFYHWLHHTITQTEHHEIDEWFKVDGVPIYDPHKPKNVTAAVRKVWK